MRFSKGQLIMSRVESKTKPQKGQLTRRSQKALGQVDNEAKTLEKENGLATILSAFLEGRSQRKMSFKTEPTEKPPAAETGHHGDLIFERKRKGGARDAKGHTGKTIQLIQVA